MTAPLDLVDRKAVFEVINTAKNYREGQTQRSAIFEGVSALPSYPAPAEDAKPIAWAIKDYADGWIVTDNATEASKYEADGGLVKPLYFATGAK